MMHFKNVELAKRYNIAESTVRNWIKLAEEGKLDLVLTNVNGRIHVANIPRNITVIKRLVRDNRKYRNSLSVKTVTPKTSFYNIFNSEQIYDLARNLELHHEILRQYNYFDSGAEEWHQYMQQVSTEQLPRGLTNTQLLIADNLDYIDRRLSGYQRINVVDICVGNAMPVKNILEHMLTKGVINKYIALDISPSMLKVAERNIKEWFGNRITFEGHLIDVTHQRFSQIIARGCLADNRGTVNLLFFLGSASTNFRNPLDAFRVINESMCPDDLLIHTERLEEDNMRPEWYGFEYGHTEPKRFTLAQRHRLVLDLLNIRDTFYEAETGFDTRLKQRYSRIRLKIALNIQINSAYGLHTIKLEKGDTILVWRSWQTNFTDIIERLNHTGFSVLHASQTEDQEYILTVSKVKRD